MDVLDHELTRTHGSEFRKGAGAVDTYWEYRRTIQTLVSEGKVRAALAIELRDVRRVARETASARKYNRAVREMMQYARSKGLVPGKAQ